MLWQAGSVRAAAVGKGKEVRSSFRQDAKLTRVAQHAGARSEGIRAIWCWGARLIAIRGD